MKVTTILRRSAAGGALLVACAAALVACGPTSYVDNRESFEDNIELRLDTAREQLDELQELVEAQEHVDPDFDAFVSAADLELLSLRAEVASAALLEHQAWSRARRGITRQVRQLEQRLAKVRIGTYP